MNRPLQPRMRIGEGWDIHALVEGRPLILGGVEVPHTHGLLGHSDADALCHAITDALFGAVALGEAGVTDVTGAARLTRAADGLISNVVRRKGPLGTDWAYHLGQAA